MKKAGNILIVDDNPGVLTALQLLLRPYFDEVVTLASPITLPTQLRQRHWQVLLLDMNFTSALNTGNEGLYWLHEVKKLAPALPVVLFTAYADIDLAVRGIKEGAADFVVKPWDNDKLLHTLLDVARPLKQDKGKPADSRQADAPALYWGTSPLMQQLRLMVEKVAVTDANILITGENGTGKEMLAREIHARSPRHLKEVVTVDMGAVSETLFESELFGHVKGAFTDAHADRAGKFEAAQGSTLFLDEIGNLPYHLQAKLLTALQRRSIVRVGSNESVPVDIRLICATNRNLGEMVAQEKFREDLLYRINTIHLELPPLRQRPDDIVPLAEVFVRRLAARYNKVGMYLSPEAAALLRAYTWPGNIRELEHAIEKAVIISDSPTLTPQLFSLPRAEATPTAEKKQSSAPDEVITLDEMEADLIRRAIDQCGGNLSAVAARLAITRQTLYNKMKKYGI